jgi:hypothetical protein
MSKDSYKADIYNFDIEHNDNIINLIINNVISWDYIKIKLTKEEIKGLADFLNKHLENN